MSKELEEAISRLREIDIKYFLSGSIEQSNYITETADKVNKDISTALNHIDNSIPIKAVENKIEKYKQLELESFNKDSIKADEYRAIITVLQELLEGK